MSDVKADIRAIFCEAMEFQSPEEVRRFLDDACGDNANLRAEVQSLLHSHRDAGRFLGGTASELSDFVDGSRVSVLVGTSIGPYKIREQIGEGGMGEVFVAEQSEPVRRKVALKIIKPGMATRDVIARFEAERQALAMMEHPNIARVFDAGTTGPASGCPGQPYFVMELVQGPPITEYCDGRNVDLNPRYGRSDMLPACQLAPAGGAAAQVEPARWQRAATIRDRLELFLSVCRAVQHAHQKGIIHRDLKPTNVLVPVIDGAAVPKVIDFGVAKAIDQKLTEKTVYTQYSQMIGTPTYMSPEQAGLGVVDVDTRSDIYSLGVLLYELLTGTTPFDGETLKQVGFEEMQRIIREQEPRRPSAMVSTLKADALSTLSEKRRTDPHKLADVLQGELDWIVMQCLEKDRNRRYESASALAADIERYLHDEPVQACPPSAAYRFRKFARRNRPALLTAALVAASLVSGTAISIWQANVARRAEALAEQRLAAEQHARRQAIAALVYLLGDTASANEWDQIVAQIAAIEPSDPSEHLGVARALYSMGEQENRRGNYRMAERLGKRSVALRRAVVGDHHLDTARSLNSLGFALQNQQKVKEADGAYRQALVIFREHFHDYDWQVLFVSSRLLAVAQATGDGRTIDEIRARAEEALQRTSSDLDALRNAARIFVALGQWKQAEQCIARTIELDQTTVYPRHYIALLQLVQKNHEGYRATCQAALEQGEVLADFNSHYVVAWTCLIGTESGVDREQIDALVNSALDGSSTNQHYKQAAAIALYRAGRYEEAETRFLDFVNANTGADTEQLHAATARFFLAMTQQRQNRPDEARLWLELATHEAEIVHQNPRIAWDNQLVLKLWREEAQQLLLAGDWQKGDSPIAADASDKEASGD